MQAVTEQMREDQGPAIRWREAIDRRLAALSGGFGVAAPLLGAAMEEAALSPGKRFRGTVLLLAGQATGEVCETLIDAACALELAHTASLVFDDLPCMDDARMRRGQPTTHVAHGESRAILAGIALVTESLRILAATRPADPALPGRMVAVLAQALGPGGLCAGQELDLNGPRSRDGVMREHDLKTGALFVAGFEILSLLQRLSPAESRGMAAIGHLLGQVFQSYDDLLDVMGDAGRLGKDTGRDAMAPGPGRGLLSVVKPGDAAAHYAALRHQLSGELARQPFDTTALQDYIARVLPVAAPRAA